MQPSKPALPCLSCSLQTDLNSTRNRQRLLCPVRKVEKSLPCIRMTLQFNFLAVTTPSAAHRAFLAYLRVPARSAERVARPGQAGPSCPSAWRGHGGGFPGWRLQHCGGSMARPRRMNVRCSSAEKTPTCGWECCQDRPAVLPLTKARGSGHPAAPSARSPPGHAEPPPYCGGQGRN